MKREIKFSYIFKHGYTGAIFEKIFTLDQIENGKVLSFLLEEPHYLLIKTRQFTGMLDKNGKEIYEGDIMQHTNPFNSPFVVNWDNEESSFVFNDGTTGYLICDKSFRIIGNIYENPGLL